MAVFKIDRPGGVLKFVNRAALNCLLWVAFGVLLSGCEAVFLAAQMESDYNAEMNTIENRQPLWLDTNKAQTGAITVIRKRHFAGSAVGYIVTLNHTNVFDIHVGQYTTFKLNEGKYHLGIKCFGGWTNTWNEESIEIRVSAGSKSYFMVGPNLKCAGIKTISEAEALPRLKKYKSVQFERP